MKIMEWDGSSKTGITYSLLQIMRNYETLKTIMSMSIFHSMHREAPGRDSQDPPMSVLTRLAKGKLCAECDLECAPFAWSDGFE